MAKPLYLTTTLPYVNAEPHIGFALEMVQADIIARFRRLMGDEVFFNTGTDEHGQKVFQNAKEEGRDVQEYVDHFATEFKKLRSALDLSYDAFIRTTDAHHVKAAQELWRRCEKAGDIYKKKYKGLYCVGDEAFVKESELVNGKCPNHPTMELVEIEEENYFFRLSKYQDKLLKYLGTESVVVPDWRRQEAINFVTRGLEDFSVSRVKEKMSWGIPVPGDPPVGGQVMYVWFDALTNYISTLGWPCFAPDFAKATTGKKATQGKSEECLFEKYWVNGETLQLAGKDQVRFQSVMWQAMLLSAGLPTTKQVIYHGFITSGGQKMSKSIGNVIDPLTIVAEYGTDALRYFLARHVHPFEDSDVTMERFKEAYNADLANGIGNLAARIMALAASNLTAPVERPAPAGFHGEYEDALAHFEYNRALEFVRTQMQILDHKIVKEEPFKLVKTNPDAGRKLIGELALDLYQIARMLNPFMPATSAAIKEAILQNKKPANLFPRKE